ncbi:hypothetical protein PQO03_17180 [Lentisphaera profundi]|uniref:Uncharacterized protein n=1 Tax=Lentisphaera profundi TaxID=1658616 RepID=A0ABY7VU29_9BACT|nr:hypothetical protein [Lentisphaera profundi]WDE97562.1 hypothetical protein PQO03_17180 [Lentisphaera profundi]
MIKKTIYLLLIVISSAVYAAQPKGLKEARDKSEAAYRLSKEQFKKDGEYKKLFKVLIAHNHKFQKMQKDAGIKGGIAQAERIGIIKN